MSVISPHVMAETGRSAAKRRISVYRIESENLTLAQIAERLAVSVRVATSRLEYARRMPGPVTWERLRR
jgi:DNA-directed RNA polymerase specialized sigma24 family protein